jgi:CheY-like chemotaxis protein
MSTVPGVQSTAATSMADARILLVEDDPDDVYIIQRILGRAPISVAIDTCDNGREALSYLERCAQSVTRELPDLILLDLNMPVMDGHEFIRELRAHPSFAALPVCVFTTSADEDVIKDAYRQGANAVVVKVDSLDGMSQILNTIVDFWFRTAKRYCID